MTDLDSKIWNGCRMDLSRGLKREPDGSTCQEIHVAKCEIKRVKKVKIIIIMKTKGFGKLACVMRQLLMQ